MKIVVKFKHIKGYLACLNNYNEYYEYSDSNYSHNLNVDFNIQRYKISGGFKNGILKEVILLV